jgi:hypothetical protein
VGAVSASTNGNTTAICDATGETGNQTIAAQVNVGNSAGASVALIMPCNAVWTPTMTDGVSVGVNQYGGSSVIDACFAAGISNNMNIAAGPSANLKYVYTTTTSTQPYLYAGGFTVKNTSGTPTVSGVTFFFQGPLNDGTTIDKVNVYDTTDTYNVKAYNISSGTTWQNSSFNAGNHGTPFFMYTDNSGYVTALSLLNDTIVHPGTGNYGFYCLDVRTSSYGKISTVNIGPVYTENNPDGVTATYGISGCGKVSIQHATVKCYSTTGNCTAPGVNISNAFNSQVMVDDMRFMHGQNNYTYPVEAVINQYDGVNAYTDSVGNLGRYEPQSSPDYMGQLSVGNLIIDSTSVPTMAPGTGAGTSPTCTTVTGNNNSMVLSCTTGTSPAASATLATITYSGTLAKAPSGCQLTPLNNASSSAMYDLHLTTPSTTSFTIVVGTTSLSASTNYSFNVLCL